MSVRKPVVRLGVLNMTISFEQPQRREAGSIRQNQQSHFKVQTTPSFIPRYYSHLQRKVVGQSVDEGMSPYQKYRRSHKDRIQLIRQQELAAQTTSYRIQGLNSKDNFAQLQVNELQVENQQAKSQNRYSNDSPLKKSIDRLNFKKTGDYFQEKGRNFEKLAINFGINPQQNLKTFFTIRPITTIKKLRSRNIEKATNLNLMRPLVTRIGLRTDMKNKTDKLNPEKIIRPWSTSRNTGSKSGVFDFQMLEGIVTQR